MVLWTRSLMPPPLFIYGTELVRSPPDLIDTTLFWYQPSIVGAIKMWNCLTQHSKRHFCVWRRVFANGPRINGLRCLLKPATAPPLEIFGQELEEAN